MKIIAAPDSYKNALRASSVACAMARGWQQVRPQDEVVLLPMSDGGEGLCDALCTALNGTKVGITVHDSLMRLREGIAVTAGDTAVVESAEANGIELLDRSELSPLKTTTYGVGELIKVLIEKYHCRNFIVGIGGSATVDGGIGMLQALGYRFYRSNGELIAPGAGGGVLNEICRMDGREAEALLSDVKIRVACDVTNILCGSSGSAAVFGPQKGASEEDVKVLDANLAHFARIWNDPGCAPGDGAAGGLGFALRMLGATMVKGAQLVMEHTGFFSALAGADLVLTGEGCSDDQTVCGKLCSEIARAAKKHNVPTVLISGALRGDCRELEKLFAGCFSVSTGVCTLDEALAASEENIVRITRNLAAFAGAFLSENKVKRNK